MSKWVNDKRKEELAKAFRAGQEDMRRRAVESTQDMARKYHSISQGYATVLADQAIAIAALEVKDE